jgi:hypothetical protein
VLQQITTCKTVTAAWKTIEGLFGSQTQACIVNVRLALATTQKGAMSITEFITKMSALGDEMATAGKPLDDEEMVSYILTGLDIEYNLVVSAFFLVSNQSLSMSCMVSSWVLSLARLS